MITKKQKLIDKYIGRIKVDYPEDDKLMIDLQQFAEEIVKLCNMHIVINWAFFPEEKPNYGDEILVEFPPEQMMSKKVLIYCKYTELMDGCKWALITPCL